MAAAAKTLPRAQADSERAGSAIFCNWPFHVHQFLLPVMQQRQGSKRWHVVAGTINNAAKGYSHITFTFAFLLLKLKEWRDSFLATQSNALRTTRGGRWRRERIDVNYGRGNGQKKRRSCRRKRHARRDRPPKLHVHQRDDDHDTAEFKGSNKTR